ncbi:Uncharacterized protein TCM_024794 [Theobroma cacao]|uniref:DUF7745 domain-containing protein n=1 Tax=Theobroma cacao TaxID=3641 RepID=A0A061F4A6_THECC|nr:Uncharacterized protein TCM_024794 [Theobroma cacao]
MASSSAGPLNIYRNDYEIELQMRQIQQEKRDCLTQGHILTLPERVHLDLQQNDFTEMIGIWEQWRHAHWDNFQRMTTVEMDQHLKKKGDTECLPWSFLNGYIKKHMEDEQGLIAFAMAIYGLVVFPKVLGHVEVSVIDFFDQVTRSINPAPSILAETFKSLNFCRRKGEGRFIGCA